MSIERKCENCIYFGMKSQNGMECCLPTEKEWNLELCNYANFTPKEEVVRQDERSKTINYLIELFTNSNDAISIQTEEGKLYMVRVEYLCDYLWEPKTNKIRIGR